MAGVKGRSGRRGNEKFFARVLEEWLDGTEEVDGSIRGRAEAIIAAMGRKALEGDLAAIREIMDRVDGKPIQAHDVEAAITAQVETITRTVVDPKA